MSAKKKKNKHMTLPPHMREKYATYDILDLNNSPEEVKISAKLVKLMEPWSDEIDLSILTDCTAIAWNETLREDFGTVGHATLNNALINFANYKWLIDALKARKRMLFPNDSRIVKETFLRFTDNGDVTINAVSEVNSQALTKTFEKMIERAKSELAEMDDQETP